MKIALHVEQPAWLDGFLRGRGVPADGAAQLDEVIALAAENVARGTGGPFAAVVYDCRSGERLSAAVNVVIASRCALAHAETLALGMAQQALGNWSLAGRPCALVSSAEPCAMCLGAIGWSGIAQLCFAASRRDVEAIGFDEGARPANWRRALRERGVEVRGPARREAARRVLEDYLAGGGERYNAR